MNIHPYEVKLDNVFEGPMDLLIHLIRKAEVDIYDIPIALITDQFLAYIEMMKSLNIDFAGDFLLMAATLTQIKSKMLLPVHENMEDEEDDPRLEITKPLLEYLQMKSAAEMLSQRNILGEHTFTRPSIKDNLDLVQSDEVIKVGLFELIDAFQRILDNLSPDHRVDLTADKISIQDKISEIIDLLEEKGSITFDELFAGKTTKSDVVITFLAILEMMKLALVRVVQHSLSGIMRIFYQ
ncbi:MAG: segregation/condensation protein A [Deltaproteobacteria bacterium]|nr:segregation/condensation protein A [Deltaproteobacteria bacterium]